MDNHVLATGAVLGFLAGACSEIMVCGFLIFFIFPGIIESGVWLMIFPPPAIPFYMDFRWILLSLAPIGLGAGTLFGVLFSRFYQTAKNRVPLARGLRYGVALTLPYLWLGLMLKDSLNLVYLATYYAAALTLPILSYGLLLAWMWNRNWGL